MDLFKRHRYAPEVLASSEGGLFEIVGRRSNLPPREIIEAYRDLVTTHMVWADSRKARFRWRASAVKLSALILAAGSTVVLSVGTAAFRAALALPLITLVTLVTALDTYFGWLPRWVLMEETQNRLNALRDDIDYYLVTTAPSDEDREMLDRFRGEEQDIWTEVSRRWTKARKIEDTTPPQPPSPARTSS